jgi:Protein of unknown function (DUF3224)
MATATGTIEVDFSDETYDDRHGTQLARRRLRKVFRGCIEGESDGEFLLAMAPAGSAAYVGLDRSAPPSMADREASSWFTLPHSQHRARRARSPF